MTAGAIVAIALLCMLVGLLIGFAAGYGEAHREALGRAQTEAEKQVLALRALADAKLKAFASQAEADALLLESKQ